MLLVAEMTAGCVTGESPMSRSGPKAYPPALSLTGEWLMVSVRLVADAPSPGSYSGTLLLFNTRTHEEMRIPFPPSVVSNGYAFSPDGALVAFTTFCEFECPDAVKGYQIAVARFDDLREGASKGYWSIRYLTQGDKWHRGAPLFTADGQTILYSYGPITWGPHGGHRLSGWNNLSSVSVRDVVPAETPVGILNETFSTILTTGFTNGGKTLLFRGYDAKGAHKDISEPHVPVLYEAELAEKPSVVQASRRFPGVDHEGGLVCISDCHEALFLDHTKEFRRDISREPRGVYKLDLFHYRRDGSVRQITGLHTFLFHPTISLDGSTAAAFIDHSRSGRRNNIIIVDVRSETEVVASFEDLLPP